jgi:hypothetical protein
MIRFYYEHGGGVSMYASFTECRGCGSSCAGRSSSEHFLYDGRCDKSGHSFGPSYQTHACSDECYEKIKSGISVPFKAELCPLIVDLNKKLSPSEVNPSIYNVFARPDCHISEKNHFFKVKRTRDIQVLTINLNEIRNILDNGHRGKPILSLMDKRHTYEQNNLIIIYYKIKEAVVGWMRDKK